MKTQKQRKHQNKWIVSCFKAPYEYGVFFYKKSKEDLQRLDNVSPSDYKIVKKGYKKALE